MSLKKIKIKKWLSTIKHDHFYKSSAPPTGLDAIPYTHPCMISLGFLTIRATPAVLQQEYAKPTHSEADPLHPAWLLPSLVPQAVGLETSQVIMAANGRTAQLQREGTNTQHPNIS